MSTIAKHPMMKCGCAAQALCNRKDGIDYDPPIPSCVVHDCIEQVESPNLAGRKARCTYYGKRTGRMNECNYGESHESICHCEQPSSLEQLAFFTYEPDKPYDRFYCGCHGWD
jgi:hypothetical protein